MKNHEIKKSHFERKTFLRNPHQYSNNLFSPKNQNEIKFTKQTEDEYYSKLIQMTIGILFIHLQLFFLMLHHQRFHLMLELLPFRKL